MTELTPKSVSAVVTPVSHDPFANRAPTVLQPTESQVEIWLSSLSRESSLAYNECFALRLRGALDAAALDRAFSTLPDLHEVLRGRFTPDGKQFTIDSDRPISTARHDLSQLPAADRDAALAKLVQTEATTNYDLERGPLYRASLIMVSPDECVVLFGAHHSVCDGWSLDVLLLDASRLYAAFCGVAQLPEPPQHSFRDFASYCSSDDYHARSARSLEYWRGVYATLPAPLQLPGDGTRPKTRTFGARHALRSTTPQLVHELRAMSREHGISVFSIVFAGFVALLHRLSGVTDVAVGLPIAGHPDAGMEDCVGHMVKMAPVRCAVDPAQTFLALCQSCNERVLDARENATVGFREIVAALRPPRDPSRIPLTPVIFTHVQKYAPGKLVFPGCSFEYRLVPRAFEAFELNINVIESHEGIELHSYANAELYSQEWLENRVSEFETLLGDFCRAPDSSVGRRRGLDEVEPARRRGDSSHVERTLVDVFHEVLHGNAVSLDDDFVDLGASSFQMLHVVDKLHRRGITLPPTHLLRFTTIRKLAAELEARPVSSNDDPALGRVVPLQEGGTRSPLFLAHSMSGDLLCYSELVHRLGSDQPVFGFDGLGSHPSDMRDVVDLAQLYANRLMSFRPNGILHLAGCCFGAMMAFEIARVLRSRGRVVGLVALVGALPDHSKSRSGTDLLKKVAAGVLTQSRLSLGAVAGRALRRFADEPSHELFALELTAGLLANRAKNFTSNRSAAARYRRQYYPGQVCVVQSDLDPPAPAGSAQSWGELAQSVQTLSVPSSSESLLHAPHCTAIARFIRESIDASETQHS